MTPARGQLKTRRWNDPAQPDDGTRILVTRYRPRGVARASETWDEWWPELGPSRSLHAAFWGKQQAAISFADYAERYLGEMTRERYRIRALAGRLASGESLTLLCSSACTDPERCHRSLLKQLVEEELARRSG